MERKKKTTKSERDESSPARKVQFEFSAPEAEEVYLAGDFNSWDTHSNPMKKDRKGMWKATITLKPGRYEYRLYCDGTWDNDPFCTCCVPNEFGSENCVKIVE
jgi:1,4-alpha-glucan branching enzyme